MTIVTTAPTAYTAKTPKDWKTQRNLDVNWIKLQANSKTHYRWYEEVETYDEGDTEQLFPTGKETVQRFFASFDTPQGTTTEITTVHQPPKSYTRDSFKNFVKRARPGRHSELIVLYYLLKAGVDAYIHDGVMDGDRTAKLPDLYVRTKTKDEAGNYKLFAIEVKGVQSGKPFTNDIKSFPAKGIIVDSAVPYEAKRRTCTENGTPLIGVIKICTATDGLMFIPDGLRDSWEARHQVNTWKTDTVYHAPAESLKTFDALVVALGGSLEKLYADVEPITVTVDENDETYIAYTQFKKKQAAKEDILNF